MSGTWHEPEKLRTREHKVEYLWKEEQEKRFRKMRLYADDCECHSCDIAKGVPGERSSRIPPRWFQKRIYQVKKRKRTNYDT
jgi:hypothetical protein